MSAARSAAAWVVVLSTLTLVGCGGDTDSDSRADTSTSTSSTSTTTASTSTVPEPLDPTEQAIEADLETAASLVESNGGCELLSTQRCIANMLAFLMPDSPALTSATASADEEERQLRDLAQAEEERRILEYVAAVEAAEVAKAEEERRILEFAAAVEAARVEEQEAAEYREALDRLVAAETREAIRQGEALVQRMCGSAGGWYTYQISPVRVRIDRCNPGWSQSSNNSWNDGGSGGGDLDCEDYGYEFEIDPNDDPHGLDGDGDGIACEGW